MDYVATDLMDPEELNQYIQFPPPAPAAPVKPKPKGKGKKLMEPPKPKKTIEKKKTPPKVAAQPKVAAPVKKPDFPKKKAPKPDNEIAKEAWKLFQSRYALIFHMCQACNNGLYKEHGKYQQDGDHHVATVRMCH